jgi:hypothetical protein
MPEPIASRAADDLPHRFSVDTCFLMNLVRASARRKSGSTEEAEGERAEQARRRWNEFLAKKARNADTCAIWSPLIMQEFVYGLARALFKLYKDQNHMPQLEEADRQHFIERVNNIAASNKKLKRQMKKSSSVPPPEFVAAVLDIITTKLQYFLGHLTMVPDTGHLPEDDDAAKAACKSFLDLASWGMLAPGDCVAVLTARNARASAILTDDHQFLIAEQRLRQLPLEVRV